MKSVTASVTSMVVKRCAMDQRKAVLELSGAPFLCWCSRWYNTGITRGPRSQSVRSIKMTGPQGRILREENSRTVLTALAGSNNSDDGFSSSSSSDAGDESAKRSPQFLAAFLATLGAFSAGSIMGWTSPALPVLQSEGSYLHVTPEQGSWLGSLVNLGALFGASIAGILSQKFGRQRFLTILAFPLLASWLIVAFGTSINVLYFGRFLGGIAAGAVSVAAPVYSAEISEQRCRGALGTLFQLQLVMGILFVYGVGAVAPLKCLSFACAIIPGLYFVTFVWMPETPQFLLSRGRKSAAERSLQWLRGRNCDIQKELLSMQSAMQQAEADTIGFKAAMKALFTERATRKALIIAFGLMIFQQLSGINAVIFYSGSIFSSAGGALSPAVATLIVGVVQVAATLCATMLVDRAGRRPLLLISGAVMAMCLAGLATSFAMSETNKPAWLDWLPLISVAVYIIVFSIGFGPIPWMMMGELFSPSAKSAASAMAASLNWTLAFVVTKSFQSLLELVGSTGSFGIFSGICIIGTIFVAIIVPETKGKSLDDIQVELAGSSKNISLSPI